VATCLLLVLGLLLGQPLRASQVGAPAWNNPPQQPIPGVVHHSFHSQAMDTEVGYSLVLPSGYDSGDQRHAVIYWLHGVGDDEGRAPGPVAPSMIAAMEAGTVPPVIVVFVNGARATFYMDSPDGRFLAETAFIDELLPHVDATYRTIADRSGRAIEGFSMGGFAALSLGLKHPELFGSVTAYAPALLDVQETADGTPTLARAGGTHAGGSPPPPPAMLAQIFNTTFGGRREVFEASSPWALVRRHSARLREELHLRIVVGTADGLWNANQLFHGLLLEQGWEHEFETVEGTAHDIRALYERHGNEGPAFHPDEDRSD
jgi:enterochelin esterase-like enzyme